MWKLLTSVTFALSNVTCAWFYVLKSSVSLRLNKYELASLLRSYVITLTLMFYLYLSAAHGSVCFILFYIYKCLQGSVIDSFFAAKQAKVRSRCEITGGFGQEPQGAVIITYLFSVQIMLGAGSSRVFK